jgi:hypothetical protein
MSEAVKYLLETFKDVDKKCFEDYGFVHELSGFIHALNIRQGDYRVVNFSERGISVALGKEKLGSIPPEKKFDKEKYTKGMLELLRYAVDKDPYEIRVGCGENLLKHLREKAHSPEEIEIVKNFAKDMESMPPFFDFYSKSRNELVGSLFLKCFTLSSSCYPEAMYLMEKIGRRAFECKKGKLQLDVNPEGFGGIKNMESWKKDLLDWKVNKS